MSEILPTHSKIGASSYYRWSKTYGGCPGSVRMSEGLVSFESEYAKEGTHAHTVASQMLEKYFYDVEPAEGWLPATPEMMDAVQVYVDYVWQEAKGVDPEQVLIEHRFDLSDVHKGLYGTADAIIYHKEAKKLVVVDYKHGAGLPVDVFNNLQLRYYGLGALLSTRVACDTVELVIVQPRCEHADGKIRKWAFKSIDLIDFAADLAADARATESKDAELVPGKHCRFCPAAATKCPAIKDKALALAKIQFKPTLSYDPDQLDQALRFLPAMEAWIKQVREFAYAEAQHGRTPPGWKLVEKRATRKWVATEEEVVEYMKAATKKDEAEFYEAPTLKSPAQMEKLCSKQIGEGLRKLMQSVSSGLNLVPENDSRPAARVEASEQFKVITD